MDYHIKEYYKQASNDGPRENFHAVIMLHEAPDIDWEAIHAKVPLLPRGWFELARLNTRDRIDFTHDFWLTKLPYHAGFHEFLDHFFSSLDDIGIFITQKKYDDPYEIEMVYSLKDDRGFYRGYPPVSDASLKKLAREFSNYTLPLDYRSFLQIHNGFRKTTDCTGVTAAEDMRDSYALFQEMLRHEDPIMTSKGTAVNPQTLIPFYESFGMPFYQCFWAEWYPEEEMGNVYYSGESKTISDVLGQEVSSSIMAFPSFVRWLKFYLERIG